MNFRSRTVALVLCFFLGLFGAHWFYLGRSQWGCMYLAVAATTGPFALCYAALPFVGALLLLLATGLQILLWLVVLYDFCSLLSMHPRRFDLDYNR